MRYMRQITSQLRKANLQTAVLLVILALSVGSAGYSQMQLRDLQRKYAENLKQDLEYRDKFDILAKSSATLFTELDKMSQLSGGALVETIDQMEAFIKVHDENVKTFNQADAQCRADIQELKNKTAALERYIQIVDIKASY